MNLRPSTIPRLAMVLAGIAITVTAGAAGPVVELQQFVHDQRKIEGNGWSITKFQGEDGRWRARLMAGDQEIKVFENCGQREEWLRFLVWPLPGTPQPRTAPSLLFVLRYGGGVEGPEYLDIIDLRNQFHSLFESGSEFNFRRLEDLDGDGWPEVVGLTRHYADILELTPTASPYPTVILRFDPEQRRYSCQNFRFPRLMDDAMNRFEFAFDLHRPVDDKVTYNPDQPLAHRMAFGPLVRWVVEKCYAGRPDDAWQLLRDNATPEAVSEVHRVLEPLLESEPRYQEMLALINGQRAQDDPTG